jgi:hypothetical protein
MALRGRMGGLATSSRHDTRKTTARARAVFRSSFEREVDPEGVLTPAERARRAEAARKLHYTKLAHLAAKKRREKSAARSARTEATPSEVDGDVVQLPN